MPAVAPIETALATLRAQSPGCALAAYADMRCGMVYTVDVDTRPPQEMLDGLASRAAALLGVEDGPASAVDLTEDGAQLFLRAPEDPREALCFVCAPGSDLTSLIALATGWLNQFGAGR